MGRAEEGTAYAEEGRGRAAKGPGRRRGGLRVVRAAVDAAMLVLLTFQMTRQFLPGAVHEATGIALGVAIVAHTVLNRRWYRALPRGRWTPGRVLSTSVNLGLTAVLLTMLTSGLGMSGIAVDLGVAGRTSVLRSVHMACVHLGFLLVGVHLGLHAGPWVARARRTLEARLPRPVACGLMAVASGAVVAYGVLSFMRLDFAGYISLRTRFAFIDPTQSVVLFVLDHLAILFAYAALGWLAATLLAHGRRAGTCRCPAAQFFQK